MAELSEREKYERLWEVDDVSSALSWPEAG